MAIAEKLNAAMAHQQFESIAKLLDAAELESSNPAVLEDWPHALHLLGHIYNKSLVDARFFWKRIPAHIKQNNPELQAVWKLLQFMWQRQYQGVWQALQAYPWSAQLQPFIQALAEKTRAELLELLATAYSTVKPSKVASICGLTEQDALQAAQAQGWRWDAASGTLEVVKAVPAAAQLDEHTSLASFTQYMGHLEQ